MPHAGITRMRFFFISLLAGAASLAGTPRTDAPPQEPRPLVILVHGRGQLGFDSAETRREWKRDLDSALALVGLPQLRDEDVKLAWYADVLDPESTESCELPSAKKVDDDELALGSIARGFLATLATAMSASDETFAARGLLGDILFFVDRETRCSAEQRVASLLKSAARERRPVIVVAYSLGSLVTYAYLSKAKDVDLPPDLRLITLGSPLGVREIRELLIDSSADTLPAPMGVKSWENIYDPDDIFAAPIRGTIAFKELRDHATELASDEGAHQVRRYLRDRSVGAAVARALCATQKEQLGPRCSPF
jgi:pimeloyl-ACP methyl ester carboxylesterase